MNANALINMVMRLFLRKFINKGIDAGFDMAARRGKSTDADPETQARLAAQGKENAKRAKQGMRAARRVTRF